MRPDRQKVYERPQDFFDLDGSAWMKLNRRAAVALCSCAAARGLVLVRVEAGISRNGSFEARLDGIWDGADPPIEPKAAHGNNLDAAAFIQSCGYNAFIVTSASVDGYSHREMIEGNTAESG